MKLLELATRVALGGDTSRTYLIGCVVKRKDGAIVTALNEKVKVPTPAAHAEARALKKSDYGSVLYVSRIMRNGEWALSKPCPKCQSLIINRGVTKVYYTIAPGEYGVWYPQKEKYMPYVTKHSEHV